MTDNKDESKKIVPPQEHEGNLLRLGERAFILGTPKGF
jgi:hypothetical protein